MLSVWRKKRKNRYFCGRINIICVKVWPAFASFFAIVYGAVHFFREKVQNNMGEMEGIGEKEFWT
jgi:hypothetical protein